MVALLNSLCDQPRFQDSVEVVVVDNCSGEEHLAELRRVVSRMSNARLLESPENRGYFAGARLAVGDYLGRRHSLPDWVIVCNHDIMIEDDHFFAKLLDEDPSNIGVLAPRITVVPDKVEQNPFMTKRPGWGTTIHHAILQLLLSIWRDLGLALTTKEGLPIDRFPSPIAIRPKQQAENLCGAWLVLDP